MNMRTLVTLIAIFISPVIIWAESSECQKNCKLQSDKDEKSCSGIPDNTEDLSMCLEAASQDYEECQSKCKPDVDLFCARYSPVETGYVGYGSAIISPDNKYIVGFRKGSNRMDVWERESGRFLYFLTPKSIGDIRISKDSTRIVNITQNQRQGLGMTGPGLYIWDLITSQLIREYNLPPQSLLDYGSTRIVTNDGYPKYMGVINRDDRLDKSSGNEYVTEKIDIYNVDTMKKVYSLTLTPRIDQKSAPDLSVAISNDGSMLSVIRTSRETQTISIVNSKTGTIVRKLFDRQKDRSSPQWSRTEFSGDGKYITASSFDNSQSQSWMVSSGEKTQPPKLENVQTNIRYKVEISDDKIFAYSNKYYSVVNILSKLKENIARLSPAPVGPRGEFEAAADYEAKQAEYRRAVSEIPGKRANLIAGAEAEILPILSDTYMRVHLGRYDMDKGIYPFRYECSLGALDDYQMSQLLFPASVDTAKELKERPSGSILARLKALKISTPTNWQLELKGPPLGFSGIEADIFDTTNSISYTIFGSYDLYKISKTQAVAATSNPAPVERIGVPVAIAPATELSADHMKACIKYYYERESMFKDMYKITNISDVSVLGDSEGKKSVKMSYSFQCKKLLCGGPQSGQDERIFEISPTGMPAMACRVESMGVSLLR